jgi:hypothetical protein
MGRSHHCSPRRGARAVGRGRSDVATTPLGVERRAPVAGQHRPRRRRSVDPHRRHGARAPRRPTPARLSVVVQHEELTAAKAHDLLLAEPVLVWGCTPSSASSSAASSTCASDSRSCWRRSGRANGLALHEMCGATPWYVASRPRLPRRHRRHRPKRPGSGLIPLTLGEIRSLLAHLTTPTRTRRNNARIWAWSTWRPRHEHRARTSHYRRRTGIP